MNFIEQLENEKGNLFHFYIILGNTKRNSREFLDFLNRGLDFSLRPGDNFFRFSEKKISIGDVRKIKKINFLRKNSNEELRVFMIESPGIDREAQNAFLKTLEEPQDNTIFFLFLENDEFLLDTVKSRARILKGLPREDFDDGKKFLEDDFLNREKTIKKIKEKSENADESRNIFLNLLGEIDLFLLQERKKLPGEKKFIDIYKKFLVLKKQAESRGAGIVYIMTYLAMTLPQIKGKSKNSK